MWSMFWLGQQHGHEGAESDKEALKESVARLIRMTTQKSAGQRGIKDHIDWKCLDHTLMQIAISATSLALAGEFGEMTVVIDGDPF